MFILQSSVKSKDVKGTMSFLVGHLNFDDICINFRSRSFSFSSSRFSSFSGGHFSRWG